MELKDRFSAFVKHTGLSIPKLAMYLGFKTPQTIREILKGNTRTISDAVQYKIISHYPDINIDWLVNGVGDMLQERAADTQPMMIPTNAPSGIPLITAEAMAGALVGESYVYPQDCPRFIVPAFNNPNFLISVCGDSMEPLFRTGDIVACKTMPLSSVFFQWGKVYVVNTQQGALIKRVEPGDSNDAIVLVSDNERYKPFAIPKSEIYQIALVVGLIRPL